MDTSMNEHTDTSLTDYALGELPEAKRLELEARLKVDAAVRDEVDETQRLAAMLHFAQPADLATGSVVTIGAPSSSDLRAMVRERIGSGPARVPATAWEKIRAVAAVGIGVAVAAGLAVMLGGSEPQRPSGGEVAQVGSADEFDQRLDKALKQVEQHNKGTAIGPHSLLGDAPAVGQGQSTGEGVSVSDLTLGFKLGAMVTESAPSPTPQLPASHNRRFVQVMPQPLNSSIPQVNTFNYFAGTGGGSAPVPGTRRDRPGGFAVDAREQRVHRRQPL
ncbi:MAG: hypothetical protein QM775_07365 [Pirellulales bacterium]